MGAHATGARAGRPFFVFFAPYVPHVPLAVPEEFKGRPHGGEYGDYVHALDHHVGRRHSLTDNTFMLFASDNGSEFVTTREGHRPNGALRGRKHTVFEGGGAHAAARPVAGEDPGPARRPHN